MSRPRARLWLSGAGFAVVLLAGALSSAVAISPMVPFRLTARFAGETVAPDAIRVTVTVENVSMSTFDLFSHVETHEHERHYNPFVIELSYPTPSREGCAPGRAGRRTRMIWFMEDRDESRPIYVMVRPVGSITHTIDLGDWARRKINRGVPLGPGFYEVRARYHSLRAGERGWAGTLVSDDVRVVVSGKPAGDMCPKNPGWGTW